MCCNMLLFAVRCFIQFVCFFTDTMHNEYTVKINSNDISYK